MQDIEYDRWVYMGGYTDEREQASSSHYKQETKNGFMNEVDNTVLLRYLESSSC